MRHLTLLAIGLCTLLASYAGIANNVLIAQTLRTIAEANALVKQEKRIGMDFELEVILLYWNSHRAFVFDKTGRTEIANLPATFKPGDRLRLRGKSRTHGNMGAILTVSDAELLGHVTPPIPKPVSGTEIERGKCDYDLIKVEGIVRDASVDEIDPDYLRLILACDTTFISIFIRLDDSSPRPNANELVGAEITGVGVCVPLSIGFRLPFNRQIVFELRDIKFSHPKPSFDVPDVKMLENRGFFDVLCAPRHKLTGQVLAQWGNGKILVQRRQYAFSIIETATRNLPVNGDYIEAVGFPVPDPFKINLTAAYWRRTKAAGKNEPRPKPITIDSLFADKTGRQRIDYYLMGKYISLPATVVKPTPESSSVILDCNGHEITFDPGLTQMDLSSLLPSTRIQAIGILVAECSAWRPDRPSQQIDRLRLVAQTDSDLITISKPSWWTANRLLFAVFMLISLVIALMIYNRISARTSRRETQLKLKERTRLAIELHDSISQNLAGISMEVTTAIRLAASSSETINTHLLAASRAIGSCREELKNCLWDLRNNLLENQNMNDAIRTTLSPKTGSAALYIRFNVPRSTLDDNTAHDVLKIIRELAVNSVRHGYATQLRIAGTIDGVYLKFSVRDNGKGFDVTAAPGMDSGHFGLQGIRERVEFHEGNFQLSSKPGSGTSAHITIKLPQLGKKHA